MTCPFHGQVMYQHPMHVQSLMPVLDMVSVASADAAGCHRVVQSCVKLH